MVPADSDRISRVPPYSGYLREFITFRLQDYHLVSFRFPSDSTILWISYSHIKVLQPHSRWFGLFPFRSPLLRKSIFLSSPPVTKMFQFTGLLLLTYVFSKQYLGITLGEFPHSDIYGSKLTYSSPKHFVVCHVLHQLLVPRHSPCALSNLITICYFFLIWWDILMWYIRQFFLSFQKGLYTIYHYHIIKFSKNYFWENNLSKLSKMFFN